MSADQKGNWCILYRKYQPGAEYYVMKLQRSDGVLVSAKTYDEVFKFSKYIDAFNFAKDLLTAQPEPKYDAVVRRVCRARKDAFYLAGC
ncbi:MAG: hypothetical protein ACO312_07815 [Candidatus Nanopelagicaceae bacterium]